MLSVIRKLKLSVLELKLKATSNKSVHNGTNRIVICKEMKCCSSLWTYLIFANYTLQFINAHL